MVDSEDDRESPEIRPQRGEGLGGRWGGCCVFRQQRVVCGWEVSATEAVPHLFYSGQPLPPPHAAWT